MRAIVTDEQRRSRGEAGLPPTRCGFRQGETLNLRKGRALLRGERRRSSVTMSRIAPSSLLVAPQNCAAKSKVICGTLH
jgi:hypothetical protein